MTVTVRVTPDVVARGRPCRSLSCPVALAVAPCLPYGRLVAVGSGRVSVLAIPAGSGLPGDPSTIDVPLPPDEARRVDEYDRTGVMRPHEFTLEFPDPKGARP